MSYDLTHKAIALHIDANWGATPVIYANNQPEKPPGDAPWVRWSMRPAENVSADVTGFAERGTGILYFQVFVPESQGERKALVVARKVATLFNEKRLATEGGGVVRFERALPLPAGKSGGALQTNVAVKYTEDGPAVNAA